MTNTDTNKTCAELVQQKMVERNIQLEELDDIITSDESTEEAAEEARSEFYNLPLEVSSFKVIKILLSTGGPADWLEVKVDDDHRILSMSYHYQDWFDHAQTTVYDDSYLWDFAMRVLDSY